MSETEEQNDTNPEQGEEGGETVSEGEENVVIVREKLNDIVDEDGLGDWKQMTDKQFLEAYPILKPEDKLDEDYIMFVQYASKLAEKGDNLSDFGKYKAWLEKLITEPATSANKKRTRNIYLSQLLLQLKEGRLSGILADMPPEGALQPAREAFNFASLPPQKTVHDTEMETSLEIRNFQHISKDGRTYLAAKSLPGSAGICGYLAVSTGEASNGLWLDYCGRPINVLEKESAGNKTGADQTDTVCEEPSSGPDNKISLLMKNRIPEEERKKMKEFYIDILRRIDCILKQYCENNDNTVEITDTVIKDMMNKIKCETATVGGILCAPFDIHSRTLLLALRKKLACKLESITNRANFIDEISAGFGVESEEDLKLVDLSKNIAEPSIDDIWHSVKSYKPSQKVEHILTSNYGIRLIEAFKCLLERQKLIIYEQEKNAHQETLSSYRSALVEEIKEYVDRYLLARRDWQRVHETLQKIEEIRSETWKIIGSDATGENIATNADMITAATKDVEDQIDAARNVSRILDKDINDLRQRLQKVTANYKDVYNKLRQTGAQWKNQICFLKEDVTKQENKIKELKLMVHSKKSRAVSKYSS